MRTYQESIRSPRQTEETGHGSCRPTSKSSKAIAKSLNQVHSNKRATNTGYMRVKRRAHFGQLGHLLQPDPAAVAKRNERERNRFKLVNDGFASLRSQLPDGDKNKKMSKIETLRSAIEYIKHLQELIDENDAVNAFFSNNSQMAPSPSATGTPLSPARSPIGSVSSEPLSPEEAELVNFTNWFNWNPDAD